MNDFSLGLTIGLGMIFMLGLKQVYTTYETKEKVGIEFANVYINSQPRIFRVFNTTPTTTDIDNGEIVLVSSTTKNFATRLDERMYFVQFTTR